MHRHWVSKLIPAVGFAAVLAMTVYAQPAGRDLEELRAQMKRNLDVLTSLLVDMSARDYGKALPNVQVLRAHAETLKGKLAGRPSLFQSYAFALGQRAENLISTLEALEANKRLTIEARSSDLEFLHDIAAADFGEIVASCVACHGRYRP
jgi:cytochrome c556